MCALTCLLFCYYESFLYKIRMHAFVVFNCYLFCAVYVGRAFAVFGVLTCRL